jgi:hypothetical protein
MIERGAYTLVDSPVFDGPQMAARRNTQVGFEPETKRLRVLHSRRCNVINVREAPQVGLEPTTLRLTAKGRTKAALIRIERSC